MVYLVLVRCSNIIRHAILSFLLEYDFSFEIILTAMNLNLKLYCQLHGHGKWQLNGHYILLLFTKLLLKGNYSDENENTFDLFFFLYTNQFNCISFIVNRRFFAMHIHKKQLLFSFSPYKR